MTADPDYESSGGQNQVKPSVPLTLWELEKNAVGSGVFEELWNDQEDDVDLFDLFQLFKFFIDLILSFVSLIHVNLYGLQSEDDAQKDIEANILTRG